MSSPRRQERKNIRNQQGPSTANVLPHSRQRRFTLSSPRMRVLKAHRKRMDACHVLKACCFSVFWFSWSHLSTVIQQCWLPFLVPCGIHSLAGEKHDRSRCLYFGKPGVAFGKPGVAPSPRPWLSGTNTLDILLSSCTRDNYISICLKRMLSSMQDTQAAMQCRQQRYSRNHNNDSASSPAVPAPQRKNMHTRDNLNHATRG